MQLELRLQSARLAIMPKVQLSFMRSM